MKTFYLTGQTSFGNRGCEAIVRSTVQMLGEQFGECHILIPSADIARDRSQWPDAEQRGVRFVKTFKSLHNKHWRHVQRLPIPALKRMGWPFPLGTELKRHLEDADAVLSVGGDNYSLDYLIPSLLMGANAYAMDRGVPVALWGASVGPFEKEPDFEPFVRDHLARMSFIGVRETASETYLQGLGLCNVQLVADPAFRLEPEAVDPGPFWPAGEAGEEGNVLGFNVSPLIERYRPKGEPAGRLLDEVADFLEAAAKRMGVLLIPHVIPLDGTAKNNDALYMEGLLARLGDAPRVRMMDTTLNTAQIKHVIGRCRFFIGARTHSTIAALSSGVPTGSIAYSVKAKGINHDLFGDTRYVLDTPDASSATLSNLLDQLERDESQIRSLLETRLPAWHERATLNAKHLAQALR